MHRVQTSLLACSLAGGGWGGGALLPLLEVKVEANYAPGVPHALAVAQRGRRAGFSSSQQTPVVDPGTRSPWTL